MATADPGGHHRSMSRRAPHQRQGASPHAGADFSAAISSAGSASCTASASHSPLDHKERATWRSWTRRRCRTSGRRCAGDLIRPVDGTLYEEARKVYNGMIDRRPAIIVRCVNVADVIASVNFARKQKLPLAVRGGGHSGPGLCTVDEGLVIDLSQMLGIRVDPEARTVRVEG